MIHTVVFPEPVSPISLSDVVSGAHVQLLYATYAMNARFVMSNVLGIQVQEPWASRDAWAKKIVVISGGRWASK